ncbi:MAG: hypothetical protein SFW35_03945 [Chitinophagales bacterium]|nr:hypothetical protein [Chitinophagales bacterium]
MSDFGALILFGKDSANLSSDKRAIILDSINDTVQKGIFPAHIQEKQYTELSEWDDNSLCLKLTEYYDDDYRDEIWEFAQEEDLEEAKKLISAIKPKLGMALQISAIFTDW